MKDDAETVFEYLTKGLGLKEQDIILFGRSMGSGPSTYLASKYQACALLLMSPYTSIKDVARNLLGYLSFLSVIVYERFRNVDLIKKAKCPAFFLHGQADKLIPHTHSVELNTNCASESFIHLPPNMDHNEFDFQNDLIIPFQKFLEKIYDGKKTKQQRQSNFHKMVDVDDDMKKTIYMSLIDNSLIEQIGTQGYFEIKFDQQLYEPPKSVVEFEKRLYE